MKGEYAQYPSQMDAISAEQGVQMKLFCVIHDGTLEEQTHEKLSSLKCKFTGAVPSFL